MDNLPPEILAMIFQLVAIEQPALSTAISKCSGHGQYPLRMTIGTCARCRISYLGWINALHVCRRWRDTAIATPGLWTTLTNNMSTGVADVFLARSHESNLRLLWDGFVSNMSSHQLDVLMHILASARLRVTELVAPLSMMHASRTAFAQSPLCNLRRLEMECDADQSAANILDPLTIVQSTALRELSVFMRVQNIAWRSVIPRLAQLRVLEIDVGMPGYLTENLFVAVQAIDSLEILRLHGLRDGESIAVTKSMKDVELATCTEVDLEGEDEAVATVLGVLRLRTDVRLRVHASLRELGEIVCTPLAITALHGFLDEGKRRDSVSYLRASFEHASAPIPGSNNIFFPSFVKTRWRLCAFHHDTEHDDTPASGLADLEVEIGWTAYDSTARSSLAKHGDDFFGLAGAIGSNIQEVHLISPPTGAAIYTPDYVHHHFKSWTSVKRVRVTGVNVASRALDELSPHTERTPLFPQLSELAFSGVYVEDWTSAALISSECLGAKLARVARERRAAGHPLQRIEMSGDAKVLQKEGWRSELSEVANTEIRGLHPM
ncbi:unnamed protein product [Peniophora sp. CBMAI 1063]|nr:unnamed protein product [Peniophora sp. CBMAI 1063]